MKFINTTLILLASAFIGVLIGFSELFTLLKIGFLIVVIFSVCFLAFIVGLVFNKKQMSLISIRTIGVLIMISFFTLITSGIRKESKESRAKEIVVSLENYKSQNGFYPDSLQQLGFNDEIYMYQIEDKKENFVLRYLIDGWHFSQYSSEDDRWSGGD
jgi:hypothetical protein